MTYEEFRKNPDMTSRFRELIKDPVMEQALIILKDGKPAVDAPVSSDPIVSVRLLSQTVGGEAAINLLLSFQDPMIPPPVDPEPDWGQDLPPETTT